MGELTLAGAISAHVEATKLSTQAKNLRSKVNLKKSPITLEEVSGTSLVDYKDANCDNPDYYHW